MSLSSNLKIIILVFSSLFQEAFAIQNACPAFPYFTPKTGPFAEVNCDFHTEYEKRIKQIIHTFGAVGGRPVALNLGSHLVLKYNGTTKNISIAPPLYDDVKVFAHAALTVFTILAQSSSEELSTSHESALQNLESHLAESDIEISKKGYSSNIIKTCKNLSTLTHHIIQKVLTTKTWQKNDLYTYFSDIRPSLNMISKIAARAQLNALDQAITDWTKPMSSTEKEQIGFVVATAHQARAEQVSIQYLMKKFGKKVGIGAINEKGLVVMEGKFDEPSAYAMLARHYFDRDIGETFFNDPEHMQKDLLSDAAQEILSER